MNANQRLEPLANDIRRFCFGVGITGTIIGGAGLLELGQETVDVIFLLMLNLGMIVAIAGFTGWWVAGRLWEAFSSHENPTIFTEDDFRDHTE